MTDKQFDPRYDPMFQRGHGGTDDDPRKSDGSPAPPRVARNPDLSRPAVTTEILGEQPLSRERGLNPFIVVLWLVGPGLIVLGTVPNYDFFDSRRSGVLGRDVAIWQEILWSLSPSGVIIGLAVIAGLLFWHAYRWQSRRAQSHDHEVVRRPPAP